MNVKKKLQPTWFFGSIMSIPKKWKAVLSPIWNDIKVINLRKVIVLFLVILIWIILIKKEKEMDKGKK